MLSGRNSFGSTLSLILFCQFVLMQRVTRPRGGINEWLHWLPVSLHKQLYYIIRQIYYYSRIIWAGRGKRSLTLTENGGSVGLSSVLEADVKSIVTMARETSEKYVVLLCFNLYVHNWFYRHTSTEYALTSVHNSFYRRTSTEKEATYAWIKKKWIPYAYVSLHNIIWLGLRGYNLQLANIFRPGQSDWVCELWVYQ